MFQHKTALIAKLDEVINKANDLFAGFNVKPAEIKYEFVTKGKSAGQAIRRTRYDHVEYTIRLSLEAAHLDLDDMLNDTIPHEVAHIVCFHLPHKGNNHNAGWKHVCRQLGGSGNRTHSMKLTPAKKMKTFIYQDSKGNEHEISAKRHTLIQKGRTYTCRRSGGELNRTGFIRRVG